MIERGVVDEFWLEGIDSCSRDRFLDLPDPRLAGLDRMEIGKVLGKIADSTTDLFGIFFSLRRL